MLPEFLERYPDVRLDLKLSDTQVNLIEGGYDLALRNSAIADSSLRARKLADDKRILCASPSYLELYGTPDSPDDLSNHQLLIFSDGPGKTLAGQGDLLPGKFPPANTRNRIVCDDGACMRVATAAGVGISMNSLWSVYREIEDGSLMRVLPDYEIEDQSAIWLIYPKSNVLTAKVRVFIDFLLGKIGDPPPWEKYTWAQE